MAITAGAEQATQLLSKLGSKTHLEREKAIGQLLRLINSGEVAEKVDFWDKLKQGVNELLRDSVPERRLGGLRTAKVIIQEERGEFGQFEECVTEQCVNLLEDEEVRVRVEVGECLGELAKQAGDIVYVKCGQRIIQSIQDNMSRDDHDASSQANQQEDFLNNLLTSSYKTPQPGQGELRHHTEGWKCLETSYKALHKIIQSLGQNFAPHLTLELIQLTYNGLSHLNRFVRETGFQVLGEMFKVENQFILNQEAALKLREGLSDNWSQVRYAASVATRTFFQNIQKNSKENGNISNNTNFVQNSDKFDDSNNSNNININNTTDDSNDMIIDEENNNDTNNNTDMDASNQVQGQGQQAGQGQSQGQGQQADQGQGQGQGQGDKFMGILLPPMCLNRYYVAEGVRQYSQETWRIVMGDKGADLVGEYCEEVVKYYVWQSKANNHAVREAACACIAELMHKVDKEKVSPYVVQLLGALVNCFKDASWPVRDAACLACGRCVLAFPEESRQVLDELYQLWFSHLQDNIYSVREDSAVALGDVVRAYGSEAKQTIYPVLIQMLPKAKEQPSDSKKYSGLENTTTFGVAARRARDNDEELHTNQQMFSCGSLAPKLQRGGGCIDHGFQREKEAWEASDGAVYLVRELAGIVGEEVGEFLPEMAEIAKLEHFAHCYNLRETVWKALPVIAKGMGKKKFKAYLELFLQPLFDTLYVDHQLAQVAAGKTIGFIRDFIGPSILAGRLTENQKQQLQSNQNIPPGEWQQAGNML